MNLLLALGRFSQVKPGMTGRSSLKENSNREVLTGNSSTRVRRKRGSDDGGGGQSNSGRGNSQGSSGPGKGNGSGDCSKGSAGCTNSTPTPSATQTSTPNLAPPAPGRSVPATTSIVATPVLSTIPIVETTHLPLTVPITTTPTAETLSSLEDTTLILRSTIFTTLVVDITTTGDSQFSFTIFLNVTETTVESSVTTSMSEAGSSLSTSTANTSSQSSDSTPYIASQDISSKGAQRLSTEAQAGIIAGVLIGILLASVGVFLVVMRSRRHQRQTSGRSTLPPAPFPVRSLSQARRSTGWFVDLEPALPALPSQHNSSTGPTISTGEIFPAISSPRTALSPGLSNNPVPGNVVRSSGYVRTIIKPLPFQDIKQVDINSRRSVPRIRTTDLYIQEKSSPFSEPSWTGTISRNSSLLPFEKSSEDDGGGGGEGRQHGQTETLSVQHKPGGRWSDPFTAGWRGSGEASDGGNRWKSAVSWVRDQTHRLETPLKKVENRRSGLSL